jgi:hypothetical protein
MRIYIALIFIFLFNSALSQESILAKYSNGHADISLWYKVGKFKIVLGPCLDAGKDQENIDLHVSVIKKKYSYEEIWIKHSTNPIALVGGFVDLDTLKKKIVIELYEKKNGELMPLIVNGKHSIAIEDLKKLQNWELNNPDKCIFNKQQ